MAIEDFTTYAEFDEGGDLTVTATKVDVVGLQKDEDAHVSDSKGIDHFDGDFDHDVELFMNGGSSSNAAEYHPWAMANSAESSQFFSDNNSDCLFVQTFVGQGYAVVEIDGGNFSNTSVQAINDGAVIFFSVVRDESVGSFGSLECFAYSDSGRTNLIGSRSQLLGTNKKDFEFVFGAQSKNGTGTTQFTGFTQNLDLQEGVVPPEGEAALTGTGAITATGVGFETRSSTLTGTGAIVADGVGLEVAAVSLTGVV